METWRRKAFEGLRGFAAPRVVTAADFRSAVEGARGQASASAVRNFVQDGEDAGSFVKVRKGLWLNLLAQPAPVYAEAARHVRRGAVVSLQTVLGDAGVLNNFTPYVYCVVPVPAAGPNPDTSDVEAGETSFFFRAIKQEVLEAGDVRDRLNPAVSYPRATAEAALVHWMYLAGVQRSPMKEPDTQCDVSFLDMDRLARLSEAAGVRERVEGWVERCRRREEDDDERVGWSPGAV